MKVELIPAAIKNVEHSVYIRNMLSDWHGIQGFRPASTPPSSNGAMPVCATQSIPSNPAAPARPFTVEFHCEFHNRTEIMTYPRLEQACFWAAILGNVVTVGNQVMPAFYFTNYSAAGLVQGTAPTWVTNLRTALTPDHFDRALMWMHSGYLTTTGGLLGQINELEAANKNLRDEVQHYINHTIQVRGWLDGQTVLVKNQTEARASLDAGLQAVRNALG